MDLDFTFKAPLWLYSGEKAQWHFITLPPEAADEIKFFIPAKSGFGSIRVTAQIGTSKWKTSIFPDKASASYLLPVKKDVRTEQGLSTGDMASVNITILL